MPDIGRATDEHFIKDTPWVSPAAVCLNAAAFLDSYTDESDIAQQWPSLVHIMRHYAADLRWAAAKIDESATSESTGKCILRSSADSPLRPAADPESTP